MGSGREGGGGLGGADDEGVAAGAEAAGEGGDVEEDVVAGVGGADELGVGEGAHGGVGVVGLSGQGVCGA